MTFRKGDCLLCLKTGTLPDGSVCWACNGTGKYRTEIMHPYQELRCPACGHEWRRGNSGGRIPDRCPSCNRRITVEVINGTD